jgi:uncharacterized protein (TIGR02246 family)
MVARGRWLVAALGVSVVAAAALGQAPSKAGKQKPVARKPAANVSADEVAIRASAEDYTAAFNKGDAKAVAAAWTPDGEFTDEHGRKFQGRDEIEREFAAIFADQPGAKIEIAVDSIKFLTPEVAIESGTARSSSSAGGGPPVKYTAVHVKTGGKWLMWNVSESRPALASSADRLAGLSWLVGEWKADLGGGKTYRTTCQWMSEKSFLNRTFTVSENARVVSSGTQIIGWDPVVGQVVSWTFDSSGGFGHEVWEDRGAQWRIDASSILPDGATALSTNLLSKLNDNAFTWRSVERSMNDELLPDTAEVRVERVSQ